MNKLDIRPHDRLRPPLWNGRLMLGRFALNLSLSRDTTHTQRRAQQPRTTNRVAALRREYHVSCQELARLLDIHPSTLLALERGCYAPSLALALHLSEFFAQPVEAIFSVVAHENTTLA